MISMLNGMQASDQEISHLLVQGITDTAIIALDLDGIVRMWNTGAERLTGYSSDETVGQGVSQFFGFEGATADMFTSRLKSALDLGSVVTEGTRFRKDGSAYWASKTINPIHDQTGKAIGFVAVIYDLSLNRRAHERERLIHEIGLKAASADKLTDLLKMVVTSIGEFLRWPIGHVFLWNVQEKAMKSAKIWYRRESSSRFNAFIEESERLSFPPGVGLPGMVYEDKNVTFIQDFIDDAQFPRLTALRKAELKSGVGIPLMENGRVFASLEFFSDVSISDSVPFVELAEMVSTQVSRFLERQRAIEEQQAFFDASDDLLCQAGFDGYFRRLSPSWTKALGYTEEELLSLPYTNFIHPDDVAQTQDDAEAQAKEGKTIIVENRYRHKDGSYRWFQWHSTVIPELETIYAIARDVTETKERDRILQETLTLQNAMLDSSGYAIICVNLEGKVTIFNHGAENMFGYKSEQFVGQDSPPRLTDPESLDQRAIDLSNVIGRPVKADVQAFIELAERDIQQEFEWNYIRSDGTRFPGLLAVTALRNEKKEMTGYMGIIQDLSARREAESAKDRLLAIIEKSPDLIGFADQHGNMIFQNSGGNRLLGYPDDFDMSGMTVRDFHPEWVIKLGEDVVARALAEHGVWSGETALLHRDGTEIPASQVVFLLPQREGEPRYIATIAHDITAFKEAEARIIAQAKDLGISNQELEQFAYVASHDLQEPLRMVCSFLGLLELEFGDSLNDDAKEYIQYAVDGGMRMRALIDGLLDFSRVGRQSIELVPLELESIFEEATLNLHFAIAEASATITHDPLPTVLGDRVSLVRLVQNLISNSLKFRTEGPVKIHLTATTDLKGEVKISVTDNGIGIDPKHDEKIFMIFQRLHAKSQYPGSGIGLSICRKITERHGGRLWLDTTYTDGAKFDFTLKTSE